jgi:putative transcriptional regulator
MNEEMFNELIESVREVGAIMRGEKEPARITRFEKPNVQRIRAAYNLSQSEFARLMGVSVSTLQNWEQGRRSPQGPASVLLQVVASHPDIVWEVVRPHAMTAIKAQKVKTKVIA